MSDLIFNRHGTITAEHINAKKSLWAPFDPDTDPDPDTDTKPSPVPNTDTDPNPNTSENQVKVSVTHLKESEERPWLYDTIHTATHSPS